MVVHVRWALATLVLVAGSVALTWFVATKQHPAPPGDSTSTDDPVRLILAYSRPLTSRFDPGVLIETSDLRTPSGRRIEVTRLGMSSQEMVEQVLNGSLQAHAILPSSDIYLDMANKEWTLRTGKPLIGEKVTLTYQPYVLAVRRPMAEAMGWPDKEIGWSEVAEIAGKGWQAAGHPEWGALKLLDANPEFSDAGLQLVVSIAQSTLGVSKGLTPERLKDPKVAEVFKALDKATVWYPTSLEDLVWNESKDATPHCHMAFVPEHIVIELNDRQARRKAPPAWVAIYPKGGAITEDVTAGVIQREWTTDAQREAMAIVLKRLREPKTQKLIMSRGYRPALEGMALTAPFEKAWGVNPKSGTDLTGMPPVEEVLECQAAWQKACGKPGVKPVSGEASATTEPASARKAAATTGKNSRITPLIQCVRKCKPCTVYVSFDDVKKIGSGFIVAPGGYVVTNYHVAGDHDSANVRILDTEKVLKAKVIRKMANADLALLRIEDPGEYQTIQVADSDQVEVGEEAVVIGNPYGYAGTVSVGIISGLNRDIPTPDGNSQKTMQTNASINPGNSGGPVMNMEAELIGVAVAMREGAQNIAFVIPANRLREIMKEIPPK
jgi:S1-C subfamily serine protease